MEPVIALITKRTLLTTFGSELYYSFNRKDQALMTSESKKLKYKIYEGSLCAPSYFRDSSLYNSLILFISPILEQQLNKICLKSESEC